MPRGVVQVRVPSSSANVGPGFDVFSIALEQPVLDVEARVSDGPAGIELSFAGKYASSFRGDPNRCALGIAAINLMREKGITERVVFKVHANIPVRKGLGSSGAEAVAAVASLSYLFDLRLDAQEVVEYAASAEPGGHADNVAASALGGFVVIQKGRGGIRCHRFDPPKDLGAVVIVPKIEKPSTEAAREVLGKHVPIERYVEGVSRASLVAIGMTSGNLALFLRNAPFDPIVEPERADAGIYGAGYDREVLSKEKSKLLEEYGVAMTISGAGPSRILWYNLSENDGPSGRRPIDLAVREVVRGLDSRGYGVEEVIFTTPSVKGFEILSD